MELWIQAIILGLIQGLTEYLPISSTGHIRISAAFLGIPDPGAAFTAVTQVGTALAVALYFRHDLKKMGLALVSGDKSSTDYQLGKYMVIATAPIVLIGFFFADFFENQARDLRVIAAALIIFGFLLWIVDKFSSQNRSATDLTSRNAVLIGISQALALIPGVSRSGATMTMARFLGFDRTAAARISFLLALPAILLAAVYQMRFIGDASDFTWQLTLIASIVAFVSGYATIDFILKWLAAHTFTIFAAYRIALGGFIIISIVFLNLDPRA